MSPTVLLFAILTSSLAVVAQEPRNSLRATFIGNESLALTDGKTTIVTDFPYESGYSQYMTYRWEDVKTTGDVTCLITHGHRDHFDASLAAKLGCRVAGPADVLEQVPAEKRVPDAKPLLIGAARVTPFVTPHIQNRPLGHYSYLVEWSGVRLFFVGDTEDPEALTSQKALDVAFVSPWLYRIAMRRGLTIGAKRIIFYHQASGEALPACDRCGVLRQNESIALP